jgi:F-type H+-transporting ATPase subunit delta
MKSARQIQREARELLRLCLVNGALDEDRVRLIVQHVVNTGSTGSLAVMSRLQRLVRLERAKHIAAVESAALLSADVRASIQSSLARLYGPGIVTTFAENPSLLGGVRIRVGSDVYDGSIRGGLDALESRL